MRMFKWMLVFGVSGIMLGCAKPIEQPVASRELVENVIEKDKNLIPESYWAVLDSGQTYEQLQVSIYQITLLDLYQSASGKLCRRFEAQEINTQDSPEIRVACKQRTDNAWYLSSPAVSDLTYDLNLGS
ncbi:hypothetical protein ACVFI8_02705 [Agarivorans sp. MS3-6]